MAENKTKPTDASVEEYIAAIPNDARRRDCRVLVELMSDATGEPPVMWGPSIIGFGSYHYKYASGREGDMCLTGFASRKGDISIYLMAESKDQPALLDALGKHKMGKSCLYVRRLADVDTQVLERLVTESVAAVQRLYPADSA
ncbi:MAG: DUF1801 domain-containing protein [Caldilineaceae bacterium]|nr:DUF1801 domain-containing protein [Caldilineaceae bacterium]